MVVIMKKCVRTEYILIVNFFIISLIFWFRGGHMQM